MCKEKKFQSKILDYITEEGKSIDNFKWIRMNLTLGKIVQIIRIQEQMIPKRTIPQLPGKTKRQNVGCVKLIQKEKCTGCQHVLI